MTDTLTLNSVADLTLANAARVAFDGAVIELGEEGRRTLSVGRARFQHHLDSAAGGYVYGSTTAPGARAKVQLSAADAARQSESLSKFLLLGAGLGGEMLPPRCVRLALLARLSNALTGWGKLRPETAAAIAALAGAPPPVPLRTAACSGEVIALTWLVAPLSAMPLAMGEAMALVNGSPFASAMVSDVALTLGRRLKMAEAIFALSCEAAACPAAHVDARLGEHWPDPFYREALLRLGTLLAGSQRHQLSHQAPTSWRVLPNVLAAVAQAVAECAAAAQISLQALKDNPTFLAGAGGGGAGIGGVGGGAVGVGAADKPGGVGVDAVVSSGGYHDHRAAKAIDAANNVMLDVGVLASRQIGRFLDGEGLGLPALLALPGDRPGVEYTAWGLTEPLAAARRAAEPTNLDSGLHDPAGNQSDVVGLAFGAYVKHLAAARAWDECLASLTCIVILARDIRESPLPPALRGFCEPLIALARSGPDRVAACAEPLRQLRAFLTRAAEELSTAEFAALF